VVCTQDIFSFSLGLKLEWGKRNEGNIGTSTGEGKRGCNDQQLVIGAEISR
jgi:hypothetical protein